MSDRQHELVSVVIPCRNEESRIRECLRSVQEWSASRFDVEILVVDGASTDRTRAIVEEAAASDPRIRLVDNPQGVKPVALNLGIREANGSWIVRLDAHSSYPRDYLDRCIETAERTGADNVGGVIEPQAHDGSLEAQLVQALTTHRFGVGSAAFRVGAREGPADTVPFGCFRRSAFERFGLFDERLVHSQDFEHNQRIIRKGGRVWLNPSIRVLYYNQPRLTSFFRKVIDRDGPWVPWMWYVAPHSFRLRHAAPMAFVLALFGSLGVAAFAPLPGTNLLTVLLLPYGLLALAASAQQAWRFRRPVFIAALPALFFLYHMAHGLGGLWGTARLLAGTAAVQRGGAGGRAAPEGWRC